jgi:hypothetical protein
VNIQRRYGRSNGLLMLVVNGKMDKPDIETHYVSSSRIALSSGDNSAF